MRIVYFIFEFFCCVFQVFVASLFVLLGFEVIILRYVFKEFQVTGIEAMLIGFEDFVVDLSGPNLVVVEVVDSFLQDRFLSMADEVVFVGEFVAHFFVYVGVGIATEGGLSPLAYRRSLGLCV